MTKRVGVYWILDVDDQRHYVGSSVNLDRRAYDHERLLKRQRHTNWELQRAYNKDHELVRLELETPIGVDPKKIEQELLDEYMDTGLLFNIARDATAPTLGRTLTDAHKQKVGEFHRGRKNSPETLQRMREVAQGRNKGRVASEETRCKMSEARKGQSPSEACREATRIANAARPPLTQEQLAHRRHISLEVSRSVVIEGVQYSSIRDAARCLNLSRDTLQYRLNSTSGRFQNWKKLPV